MRPQRRSSDRLQRWVTRAPHNPTHGWGGGPPATRGERIADLRAELWRRRAKTATISPVPRYHAHRELLASREDVWRFLAEPTRLADWWPGLLGVTADRRGLAPGARWRVQSGRPNTFVGPKFSLESTIVFIDVEPPSHVSWQFVQDRYDVDLTLAETGPERTRADLVVTAPMLSGLRRRLPYRALSQLYALCQTGAPTG